MTETPDVTEPMRIRDASFLLERTRERITEEIAALIRSGGGRRIYTLPSEVLSGEERFYVIVHMGETCPQIVATGAIRIRDGHYGQMAVHPGFRGQGLRTKIFERIKRDAIEHGLKELYCEVLPSNYIPTQYLKRTGFENDLPRDEKDGFVHYKLVLK